MKTLTGAAFFLSMMIPSFAQQAAAPTTPEVDAMMEKIRAEHEAPAIGGAVIVDGELKVVGAAGMRKFKGKEAVTADDKWHIGSCTKSMTATLAATFVEEGKLKWDSTIGEVFGRKIKMRDEYKDVTLMTLLNNRSGIPGSATRAVLIKAGLSSGNRDIEKRRQNFAEELLKMKPDFEPGSEYAYSNSGFVVAGAMLEVIGRKSWEELMQERVFRPLKMASSGFGGAASKGKEDQPWGHGSKTKPQPPGRGDDNPDVIGPAGTVHCSLADLASYVKMHATHEVGPVLKKAETFVKLQSVGEGNDDYACGWVVKDRPWSKGPALWHNGSNTMNYCVIWIAPARKFAVIAVTNVGDSNAACDAVVSGLISKYLADGGAEPRAGADNQGARGAKVAPFSGVRWDDDAPVVQIGKKWFKLVSLDGIAVADIVAFSQKAHGDRWQKRIAEDLVEVLEGMDHEPKETVKLVVQALDSSKTQTLDRVAMTKANRDAIKDAGEE